MSDTLIQTTYTFTIDSENPAGAVNGGFQMYAGPDGNDELAFAILNALNALPWPEGVTNPVGVSKNYSTEVISWPDLTQNPAAFT